MIISFLTSQDTWGHTADLSDTMEKPGVRGRAFVNAMEKPGLRGRASVNTMKSPDLKGRAFVNTVKIFSWDGPTWGQLEANLD